MRHGKSFTLLTPAILLLAGQVFSQVSLNTGSIYGKVLGPEGKPLSNVSVLLEAGGMAPKTAATGASGTFLFPALVPGNYSLTFSLQGFSEIRQKDVPVRSLPVPLQQQRQVRTLLPCAKSTGGRMPKKG